MLVRLQTTAGIVYVNPDHVITVRELPDADDPQMKNHITVINVVDDFQYAVSNGDTEEIVRLLSRGDVKDPLRQLAEENTSEELIKHGVQMEPNPGRDAVILAAREEIF